MRGGQAVETEVLAPQLERLQVAGGEGVFVIARMGLAGARGAFALGVKGADAALPAGIEVDEGIAKTTTVVEAELRFADAAAGNLQQRVINEVACA
ncbi:hypothetical protein D9M71_306340 [compost metagenome]